MDKEENEIDVVKIAEELAKLPEITEANNWPHRNKIIYALDKPNDWATICAAALNLTENQILKIWFLIEFVNGKRRHNPSMETLFMISDVLEEAKRRIEKNSGHASYKRLLELWAYHSAHVHHMLGEFDKAAISHEVSYSIAKESGVRSELLALYNLEFARLAAAIAEKKEIKKSWNNFWDACSKLMTVLDKAKEEDMRWMANVCYNLMLYSWLIDKKVPGKVGISFLEKLPETIKPSFENHILIMRALALIEKKPEKAIDIIGGILTNDAEVYLMALVVMIQAKLKIKMELHNLEEFKIMQAMKDKPGAHLALAILKNLL